MSESPFDGQSAEDRIRDGVARSEAEQRVDLAEVREDLGDTVEELVRRVDVPNRVRAKRDETLANARRIGLQAKAEAEARVPAVRTVLDRPAIAAAAGAALLVALVVWRRVRRRSVST